MGSEEVYRAFLLADQDYPAGDGRAGVDHPLREAAQNGLRGPVQGQLPGETGKRRHALLQERLHPRPLGGIGHEAFERDQLPIGGEDALALLPHPSHRSRGGRDPVGEMEGTAFA